MLVNFDGVFFDIFRGLLLNTTDFEIAPVNTSFSLRCELTLNRYWLGEVQRVPLQQLISKS